MTLRPLFRPALLLCTAALSLGLGACNDDQAKSSPAAAVVAKPFSEFFKVGLGDQKPRLQIAISLPEQQQGLMHRRDLGADDGMIFVYAKPQMMHFWMRNTPTPLDIGFFNADGVLVEVYPLRPFDETTVSSLHPAKYAVEMSRDWYQKNGVKPGAKLDIKALAEAIQARGLTPTNFGVGN